MFFNQNQTLEIREFYSKNGFAVIKNVFKKVYINRVKKKILSNIKKNRKDYFFENTSKGKLIRRIEKVTDHYDNVKNMAYSKKIFKLLNLNNKKNVLFKDKLNFKFANGAGFLPHLDGHFFWSKNKNRLIKGWKIYSNKFTNVAIHLDAATKKNGCLYIASKEDTKKIGKNWKEITKKLTYNTPNISKKDLKKFKFFPMEANQGDVVIFDWKCGHYSNKNKSKSSRMILYLTYCQNDSKTVRKKYYDDKLLSKTNESFKGCLYK